MNTYSGFYKNQILAAIEIVKYLNPRQAVLLSSMTQAGKTGAVMCALLKLCKEDPNTRFLIIGPSDRKLLEQTRERFKKHPELWGNLIGSDVYHAAQIYSQGKKYEHIQHNTRVALETGKKIVVVYDEAHIGIGFRRSDLMKIPQFLKNELKSLPGFSTHHGISVIFVTATPFDFDYYLLSNEDIIKEVYLQPGLNFTGISEIDAAQRYKPSYPRTSTAGMGFSRQEKIDYQNKERLDLLKFMVCIFEDFLKRCKDDPQHFIIRCTNTRERCLYAQAAGLAGIDYQDFLARLDNIKEFEERLKQKPTKPQVMLIMQSYKQGKTLDLSNVGGWYESETVSGRHEADYIQSFGRCCGYNKQDTFPIYVDLNIAEKAIDYYNKCKQDNLAAKHKMPMDSTNTKHKEKLKFKYDILVADSEEEAQNMFYELYPEFEGLFGTTNCSKNKSYDVIQTVEDRKRRQTRGIDINILHIDNPSPYEGDRSWKKHPEWHNKWIIVHNTGEMMSYIESKSKAYINNPDKLSLAS